MSRLMIRLICGTVIAAMLALATVGCQLRDPCDGHGGTMAIVKGYFYCRDGSVTIG